MWETLTEAQAILLSGLLTVGAAVLGVLLGARLFGGKVADLQSALDKSTDAISAHGEHVEQAIAGIKDKIAAFDEQVSAISSTVNKVSASLIDLEVRQANEASIENRETAKEIDDRRDIRTNWFALRDLFETIASDSEIDGRTRARYGRIDRRSYDRLFYALHADGFLRGSIDDYVEAYDLWLKYRNGRLTPSHEDAERMSSLVDRFHDQNGYEMSIHTSRGSV